MTTNILLAVFVYFMIPETKSIALEEIDVLFGGANHTEKGGDLLHVEDAHHAHIGVDNVVADHDDKIAPVVQHEQVPAKELKI
jgi:hypothetical protein